MCVSCIICFWCICVYKFGVRFISFRIKCLNCKIRYTPRAHCYWTANEQATHLRRTSLIADKVKKCCQNYVRRANNLPINSRASVIFLNKVWIFKLRIKNCFWCRFNFMWKQKCPPFCNRNGIVHLQFENPAHCSRTRETNVLLYNNIHWCEAPLNVFCYVVNK